MATPTGEYAEQMLDPDGWPEVNEETYHDRAQQYTEVLRQVTEVLETCQHKRVRFSRWYLVGRCADAANGELGTKIDELMRCKTVSRR